MAESQKVNILVVDDLPEKLLIYESILGELGENLILVRTGAEALKQVLTKDFAVILLDVNMPDMDGFETALMIRKRAKSAHTPIIFITAYFDDVRTYQGYAHGAVDYILAPVKPEILKAKVKVFIDLFRMHQQVERRAEERVLLAQEHGKRLAAESANRNSTFLAKVSAALAKSLDVQTTIQMLAHQAVPYLADACIVHLCDESSSCYQCCWTSQTGVKENRCFASLAHWPDCAPVTPIMERVQRSGKTELLAPFVERVVSLEDETSPGPQSPKNHPLHLLESVAVLPLPVRGRMLGSILFAYGAGDRHYSSDDLVLVEDYSHRAAIALDNAILVRNIKEADQRKDEFLAMLAHELRNPLAPIRNAVEILRFSKSTEPSLLQARDLLDRQTRHLTRLVDDLLDVSRITRGKIQLQMTTVDLASTAVHAVEASRPLLDARRHEFCLKHPTYPILVNADSARIIQVLANLLNNAAKYTSDGGSISLSIQKDGTEAIIRVRDSGDGIPADQLNAVFEPFVQLHNTIDRAHGGLGVGLTLVRRLVELHQGSVRAHSEGLGCGSEFEVRLPCAT